MKNMETTRAMASSSPMRMPARAMTKVTRTARRGSLAGPAPRANSRGVMPSSEQAWRMRGAPRMLPRALEMVAPKTPAVTSGGQAETVRRTPGSSASAVAGTR